jgi:hypothetical protein
LVPNSISRLLKPAVSVAGFFPGGHHHLNLAGNITLQNL